MSDHDDETARPAEMSPGARRKLVVGAAAGLAVLAGGGACLMASRDTVTETRDTSAVAPLVEPTSAPAPAPAESAPSAPASGSSPRKPY